MTISNFKKGSGLVEVVVGLAIIFTSIFVLIKTYNYYLKVALSHKGDVQASILLEEGVEVIKILRDSSWDTKIAVLTPGTYYSLAYTGSTWTATTTNNYIDGVFNRTFVLGEVYRDTNDEISLSGTSDIGTRKVTVFVSYLTLFGTTTKQMSAYITNLFNN